MQRCCLTLKVMLSQCCLNLIWKHFLCISSHLQDVLFEQRRHFSMFFLQLLVYLTKWTQKGKVTSFMKYHDCLATKHI